MFFGFVSMGTPSDGLTVNEEGGRLTLARMKYDGGGDWYNDPEAFPNLAREFQ